MECRKLIIGLLILILNGCVAGPKHVAVGNAAKPSLAEVYARSSSDGHQASNAFITERLTEQGTFGYVKPYIPIVEQPIVHKVWIPDRPSEQDAQMLIAGHWTYIMIQEARWYVSENLEASTSLIP